MSEYKEIYFITADCGDGSCSVEWYKSKEIAQAKVDDDNQCDVYWPNEGYVKRIKVHPETDLDKMGISWDDDGDFEGGYY